MNPAEIIKKVLGEAMLLCDPCNVALIRKIHGRDQ